jgi:hypothetical protein
MTEVSEAALLRQLTLMGISATVEKTTHMQGTRHLCTPNRGFAIAER